MYASQQRQFIKYVCKKIECKVLQSVLGIEPSWDICNPSPCTLGFYSVFSHAFAYLLCYALVYVPVEEHTGQTAKFGTRGRLAGLQALPAC